MVTEVVATRDGLYGGKVRKAGTKFNVDLDKHVSARWMAVKGTPKYNDFMRSIEADKDDARDKITGERLSAGGLAEQLSIALEEGRRHKQHIAELEAELALAREGVTAQKVEAITPAEEEAKAEDKGETPVRRRRVKKD